MEKKKRIRKPIHDEIYPGFVRGALTVIGPSEEDEVNKFGSNVEFVTHHQGGKKWLCKCACGNDFIAAERPLKYSTMGSCGCRHKSEDISGQRFGRLVAVYRVTDNPWGKARWLFQCDCGNGIVTTLGDLKRSVMPSCGCYKTEVLKEKISTHGMSHTPLHMVWSQMRDRCNNPNHKRYKDYGGRDIKVRDRWNKSFEAFYEDVIDGYEPGLQLDRINNDGDYEPDNTRWVTPKENSRNKRDTVRIDSIYGLLTMGELEEVTGIRQNTLFMRRKRGVPDDLITIKNCKGIADLKPLFEGAMFLTDSQEKRLYEAYAEANEEARTKVPHG